MQNPVSLYATLKQRGIMGMNARNRHYISRYNPRHHYPLVDNKLLTKTLAITHKVNVPELLGIFQYQHDVSRCSELLPATDGFCIKPAKGSGGKGILVVRRDAQHGLQRTDGTPLSIIEVQRHISNILAGVFSLGGDSDVAMIESLIETDASLLPFTVGGVPDIRVIVFRGIPAMAMIRLACHASRGKANLHQGAVGVGLDIRDGKPLQAVQFGRPVTHHPDTGIVLNTLQVPGWQALLALACQCADLAGLGYVGVDLVIDRTKGPIMLELNARPGLAIQIANGCGLLPRLQYIEERMGNTPRNIDDRIAFAHTMLSVLAEKA